MADLLPPPLVPASVSRDTLRRRGSATEKEPFLRPPSSPPLGATELRALDAKLDDVIDRALRMGGLGAGPIIVQYHPEARWIRSQWHGTVFEHTWRPCLVTVMVGTMLSTAIRSEWAGSKAEWAFFSVPPADHPVITQLRTLDSMFSYQLQLATFVLSIFISHAYGLWLATKGNVRKIQGRLNDLSMILATHAARDESGRYTVESEKLNITFARYVRLFHLFFWAGVVKPTTTDEYAGSFSTLKTSKGLKRLVTRGELEEAEMKALLSIDIVTLPAGLRHSAVLEWMVASFIQAKQTGVLLGGAGMEATFLDKACALRATCATIPDDLAARMPVAYVHLVQILVDSLLVVAPFALYPRLGTLSVPLSALLTVFYRGFLELSKSFLDPFGNDESVGNNFKVDTLIGESNAGSLRWMDSAASLPFSTPALVPAAAQPNGGKPK